MLRHAFTKLDLVRVHGHHFMRNPASGRVMRKLGMQHEGTRRKHAVKWGKFEDDELYGILEADWSKMANQSAERNRDLSRAVLNDLPKS